MNLSYEHLLTMESIQNAISVAVALGALPLASSSLIQPPTPNLQRMRGREFFR